MLDIKGIIPALITPMHEDESINFNELKNQVDRQIENGVHGLFCLGTNGEGYILSYSEKKEVLETIVSQANGRVPIYAGVGCISTKETINQSLIAKCIGADALSIIVPWFAAASQEEIYSHYKEISKKIDLPIVLYNIPARTVNKIEVNTLKKLYKIDNIVGVKDSSGDYDNMLQYIECTKDRKDFAVLSGNDSLILKSLQAGGHGGVAGCANIYPHTMTSIYNKFIEGNIKEAQKYQDSIQSFRACFKYGNPNTIVKKAVELLGYPVGNCKAPFCQIPEEGMNALKIIIEENKNKGMR